tara:strand:- start:987 stop:1757 length:771 start_codon:yes stop_codon:yes gene_type:complete
VHEPLIISIFSIEWWYANFYSLMGLIFLITASYVIINSRYIRENNYQEKFTKLLGFLILGRFFLSQMYQLIHNPVLWDVNHSLPFHLCGISGLVSGYMLIKFNQSLYEFVLLLGAPGALWSFLTPQINIPSPSFMYYDYFVSHVLIIFSPLFLTFVLKKMPRIGSWKSVFIKTNLLLIPTIYVINHFLFYGLGYKDVNYMYLMEPPKAENPFIFGKWPVYIVGLQAIGFIHISLIYAVFNKYNTIRSYFQIKKRIA